MPTNLRSSVNQFGQLVLDPIDELGNLVKLDADAIVAEVLAGADARTTVVAMDLENDQRRFFVNLIPGPVPGESRFKVRGDLEPGEGVIILEEEFIYTTTPANAVSLGVQVNYLPKTSLPPA